MLGIIGAMDEEVAQIKEKMTDVTSAAALWSCGGDGDGEPGPEPPVPPVVDPNAVEVGTQN